MSLKDKLFELLEPTINELGYDLVELECRSNPKSGLVRLYIDKPGGITLDDCEKVSHQVSGVLDVEDPMAGEYSLEVSSPGLDRPLRTLQHFQAVVGQKIKVELEKPDAKRRWRFTGTLAAVNGELLKLELDDEVIEFERAELKKARLVPNFNT